MALLTHFNAQNVLKFAYGDKQRAIAAMKKSFSLYWPKRNIPLARTRAKSAIAVIRKLSQ